MSFLPSRSARVIIAVLLQATAACAHRPAAPVSPAEIPRLEASIAANPDDGHVALRLAAAQLAADRCDDALPVARRGMELRPQDALGPLVAGECLERAGDAAAALALYDSFVAAHGSNVGAPAVAARALLLRRSSATAQARELIAREVELTRDSASPNVLAVVPLEIVADSAYAPLAAGLASMIASDLSLLSGFRLVERESLGALLREIALGLAGAADPATAARAGRLLRAGTIVHGVALIPPDGRVRLQVSLLDPSGGVTATETIDGRVRDLLRLEKDLVLAVADALGYRVTEAERVAILENGTRSLAAFLAYSRGVLDEEAGRYASAAANYAQAARSDPGFRQARASHRATAAVGIVQSGGTTSAPMLANTTVPDASRRTGEDAASGVIGAGVVELAPVYGDRVAGASAGTEAATTPISIPPAGVVAQTYVFGFRIVVNLP